MTAKAWLSRALFIDREIDTLLAARDKEKARAESITRAMTGDPVQGTKDPHKFDRLVELDEKIDRLVDRLVEIKLDIISAVSELEDGRYRTLLLKRYVECTSFEKVAVDMCYSIRQVWRLHGEALLKMEVVIRGMDGRV